MKDLKIVFMGTPQFAKHILENLIKNTNVVLVVSQPDAPIGRKKVLTPSPVKQLAEKNNIEVFTPVKIKDDYDKVLKANPDIIITCAYGQIIPKSILDFPNLGCINVHASLLPELRGGAPIHRAIMNGLKETGITIMYMDEHMDSGDIISQESTPILEEDNLESLSTRLMEIGSNLLIKTLPSIIEGTNERIKQDDSKVTFGYIIKKEDEHLDFRKSTKEVYNHIRALSPNPGTYFLMNSKKFKVYNAKIGLSSNDTPSKIIAIYKDGIGISTIDGEVIITEIQPEGKNKIPVKDFLNGLNKETLKGLIVND